MLSIAIFGATGGIGAELAKQYASPETSLFLFGRNQSQLLSLAGVCSKLGASVKTAAIDIRDRRTVLDCIDDLVQGKNAPDVVIFCIGVSSSASVKQGLVRSEEQWELDRELEVNAVAQITASNYLANKASKLGRLRIVLVSSLMSLTGFSGSPGYSASKAAVRVYSLAMRRLFKGTGISFSVVLPGFVDTPMSRRYIGRKLFPINAEAAAKKIILGIKKDKAEIYFPATLYWVLRFIDLLPVVIQDYLLKGYFFTVEPDQEALLRPSPAKEYRAEVAI